MPFFSSKSSSGGESTPLISRGVTPPSDASGDGATGFHPYFLERRDSHVSHDNTNVSPNRAEEEIETIPEGASVDDFNPRPVGATTSFATSSSSGRRKKKKGWLSFFKNVNKKSHAFAPTSTAGIDSHAYPRSAPVKIDPKVFFANERTFLAWMHVSVILAGASVAIVAFTDDYDSGAHQLYGIILLPVAIAFILYAMMQCKCMYMWG